MILRVQYIFCCVVFQWVLVNFSPQESAIDHGAYLHVPFCIHKGLPENEGSKYLSCINDTSTRFRNKICKKHNMIMSTEYG